MEGVILERYLIGYLVLFQAHSVNVKDKKYNATIRTIALEKHGKSLTGNVKVLLQIKYISIAISF